MARNAVSYNIRKADKNYKFTNVTIQLHFHSVIRLQFRLKFKLLWKEERAMSRTFRMKVAQLTKQG